MQRPRHARAVHDALRQRAAAVRALVAQREHLARARAEHGDLELADAHATRAALGQPDSGDAILVRDIYVADSDEQAWSEAVPEITRFWQLATDNLWCDEPITPEDLPRFTERFPYFPGGLTVERLNEWGVSLVGSPATVLKKARSMIETARPDALIGLFSFGGLSHAQVTRSIELFATRVMPFLRDEPIG